MGKETDNRDRSFLPIQNSSPKLLSFQVKLKVLDDWNKVKIAKFLSRWLNDNKLKIRDIGPSLRLCLTGKGSSIDLIDILFILGPEEVNNRIDFHLRR